MSIPNLRRRFPAAASVIDRVLSCTWTGSAEEVSLIVESLDSVIIEGSEFSVLISNWCGIVEIVYSDVEVEQ